jgi:aminomethyltransferase
MSTAAASRKTPLFDAHLRWQARMVEFGGWQMPVFYSSILEEHQAVRTGAGLFDISHMGEFLVEGPAAAARLDALLTNDVAKLAVGEGQYTLMLNGQGGVIDDLILYRIADQAFLLVVNASKIGEDWQWIERHLAGGDEVGGVVFFNRSDAFAAVALQGPQAGAILAAALEMKELPGRNRIVSLKWRTHDLWIARTGYTGEDGFEVFLPPAGAEELWEVVLREGGSRIKPAGLGCRDTLRLEACYPLNGQDLSSDKTPLEAGLGFFVALGKAAEFTGKAVLSGQKKDGVPTRLVALKPLQRGAPPRSHYKLFSGPQEVGEVTSGTLSPTLGHGIALAYVAAAQAQPGTRLEMEVRGQRLPVEVVPKPFYKKS